MRLLDRLLPGLPVPTERVCNAPVDGGLVREALLRHGQFRLTARGGSMHPAIPDGALLVVEPTPYEQIRLGNIVMASLGASWYVIHRVVGRDPATDALRLKGDSLDGMDPLVPRAAYLGRIARCVMAGWAVELNTGLMHRAGPFLGACSLGSLAVSSPCVRKLAGFPGGVRVSRLICRVLRVPGWIAAWCLVRLSRRPYVPRSNGRDTDRSGDRCPSEATAP